MSLSAVGKPPGISTRRLRPADGLQSPGGADCGLVAALGHALDHCCMVASSYGNCVMEGPGLTDDDVALVLRRATQIDGAGAPNPADRTPRALEAAAVEVGLSRNAVRQALAEMRAGTLHQPGRRYWRTPSTVSRMVPGLADAESELRAFLARQGFRLIWDGGDRTRWAVRRGRHRTSPLARAVQRIDLVVVDEPDVPRPRVLVAVTATMRPLRRKAVFRDEVSAFLEGLDARMRGRFEEEALPELLVSSGDPAMLAADLGSGGDRSAKPIDFVITNAAMVAEQFKASTDDDGRASLSAELLPGVYSAQAFFRGDRHLFACTSPLQIVTVAAPDGVVSGAGRLAGSLPISFGFTVFRNRDGMQGHMQLLDPRGHHFAACSVIDVRASGDSVTWSGTGRWDGVDAHTFEATVRREPGALFAPTISVRDDRRSEALSTAGRMQRGRVTMGDGA